jgi:hypothetical protein
MCSSYACTCIQYTCLCLCTYILYIHSIYIHIYVYLFARLFFAAKFDAEYIAAVWLILAIRIDLQPRCLRLSNGLHPLAKHRRKWRWENKQLGLSNNGPIISNNGLSLNFMAIFIEGKMVINHRILGVPKLSRTRMRNQKDHSNSNGCRKKGRLFKMNINPLLSACCIIPTVGPYWKHLLRRWQCVTSYKEPFIKRKRCSWKMWPSLIDKNVDMTTQTKLWINLTHATCLGDMTEFHSTNVAENWN